MAFRVVVIKNKCKLEYSLNYLICRGEEEKRILLDEIEMIIIQNTQVSLTCSLISACSDKKIKMIFCDSKANPQAELVSYYNNYGTFKKIMTQFSFIESTKNKVWAKIIYEKINNQRRVLQKYNKPGSFKLQGYLSEVLDGDTTNREGHAAKIYFNELFGKYFCRNDETNIINKFLNYGYSIIVSLINREIKCLGYLTELGIHHIGETNRFNLSYDFFEPLRPLIDNIVASGKVTDDNYKTFFVNILSAKVYYKGNEMFLDNAIHAYIQNLFSALIENDIDKVNFIEYEF